MTQARTALRSGPNRGSGSISWELFVAELGRTASARAADQRLVQDLRFGMQADR